MHNEDINKNISVATSDSHLTMNKINNSQPKSVVCWNVNGLSARFRQSDLFRMFEHMVKKTDIDADIIQLSETHVKRDPNDPSKAHTEDVDWVVTLENCFPDYIWFHTFSRRRYAGQCVGVKRSREIPAVSYDFGPELFDEAENHERDGRVAILEYSRVIVTCLYVPSSTMNNAVNIEHRRKFDVKLASWLHEKCKVSNKYHIVCGDLNVCRDSKYSTHSFADWHQHFLTRYPESTLDTALQNFPGCSDVERKRFEDTLNAGKLAVVWKPEKPSYISWRGAEKDPLYRNAG